MNVCPKCKHECKPCNFQKHVKSCNGVKSYAVRLKEGLVIPRDKTNLNCVYCNKQCKNFKSVLSHERLCKLNPNKQSTPFQQENFKKHHIENGATKAKKLGLPKPIISDETRQKISKHVKGRSKELKQRIAKKVSETIKRKVENNEWHTSLAKNMRHEYKGVVVHGSWELAYAKWLDINNIEWVRCNDTFTYSFEGKQRRYTPDFYLLNSNEYVEIKGYQTEKDLAKWKQFPKDKKLKILVEIDLKQLNVI
jgi:hypothetical protein